MKPSPRQILIIDNDEGLAQALSIRLEENGYACTIAACGRQGISLFQSHPYDAVITDLNMPNGSGIDVCRSVQKHRDVPVLVITGYETHYGNELAELDSVSVITKPFELEDVLDELDILLELGAMQFD